MPKLHAAIPLQQGNCSMIELMLELPGLCKVDCIVHKLEWSNIIALHPSMLLKSVWVDSVHFSL